MARDSSLIPIRLLFLFFWISSALAESDLSPLDPKQLSALRSLNLPTKTDPCSSPTILCNSASPYRHIISLTLSNCSKNDIRLTTKALESLPNLTSLHIANCNVARLRFLSRTKSLTNLTISNANLTANLPQNLFELNLTELDFSGNNLKGEIPDSISSLVTLEFLNLSSNQFSGAIPDSIGDIVLLKELYLSSNMISGSVPASIGELERLESLDLGSNQLNGTIPRFISGMKSLRYLNLEKNNFKGVMPFNTSFIKRLDVFKIGGNSNLCYNRSLLASKLKLGIAPCDKHGMPMSPPPAKDDSSSSSDDDDYDDNSSADESSKSKQHSHGPNKVVLGVAIGLSAVVFLIIFCVLVSKCCR